MKAKELKTPITIRNRTIPNRIVYQPTESNNCDENGSPTELTRKKYKRIAEGRPGMIFVESIDVTKSTQARSNRMLVMPENVEPLKEMLDEVRKINSEAPILFQLSHAGSLSDPQFKPPKYVYGNRSTMTTAEVEETIEEFAQSALRAYQAGADGVDFKQAHGFIADDFLHPGNDRTDKYGGSFDNRMRFFRTTFRRMRELVTDDDFIIGSRISPFEGIPGGCGTTGKNDYVEDLTEMVLMVKAMEDEGLDFINVSAGYASANLEILLPTAAYPEGVLRHFAWTKQIKDAVSIPVIGSGYSYLRDGKNNLFFENEEEKSLISLAEKNIRDGYVDLIGIGRQSIADPGFARKVLSGDLSSVQWCTCCSGCGILLGNNKPIGCTVFEEEYSRILKSIE